MAYDTIWRQRSGSTLVQVMACCLMAPSPHLNQWWLLITKFLWHSLENSFTVVVQDSILNNELEKYTIKMSATHFPRGQWVSLSASVPTREANEVCCLGLVVTQFGGVCALTTAGDVDLDKLHIEAEGILAAGRVTQRGGQVLVFASSWSRENKALITWFDTVPVK